MNFTKISSPACSGPGEFGCGGLHSGNTGTAGSGCVGTRRQDWGEETGIQKTEAGGRPLNRTCLCGGPGQSGGTSRGWLPFTLALSVAAQTQGCDMNTHTLQEQGFTLQRSLEVPLSLRSQFFPIIFKVSTDAKFKLSFLMTNSMYQSEGFNDRQAWKTAAVSKE